MPMSRRGEVAQLAVSVLDGALSPRERQICALVVEGFSDVNIAARLSIKETTVGSHLARIYRKLRVHSRIELARVSARNGLMR